MDLTKYEMKWHFLCQVMLFKVFQHWQHTCIDYETPNDLVSLTCPSATCTMRVQEIPSFKLNSCFVEILLHVRAFYSKYFRAESFLCVCWHTYCWGMVLKYFVSFLWAIFRTQFVGLLVLWAIFRTSPSPTTCRAAQWQDVCYLCKYN